MLSGVWGSGGIAPRILNLGTRRDSLVSLPLEKIPRNYVNGKLGGHQRRYNINRLALSRTEPRSLRCPIHVLATTNTLSRVQGYKELEIFENSDGLANRFIVFSLYDCL